MMTVVAVIPARYGSTRLPAKPLADIGGYVEKRKGDKGMTNILLGGFSDIESATLAQNKVIIKGYEGNRPHTSCRLTKSGRRRFLDYLAVLEQLVRDAAKAAGKDEGASGRLGIQPI
jgi:hypothetical protein